MKLMTMDAQQLRELIRLLERKLGLLEDSELSCCGISFAQCHALVEVGRSGCISLIDLAQKLNLDNSTMSRTISNLVAAGYAERDLDPNDRRYLRIKLTNSGENLFTSIETNMHLYFEDVLASIQESSRAQVFDSLMILLDAIGRTEASSRRSNGDGNVSDARTLLSEDNKKRVPCCTIGQETEV